MKVYVESARGGTWQLVRVTNVRRDDSVTNSYLVFGIVCKVHKQTVKESDVRRNRIMLSKMYTNETWLGKELNA